MFNILLSITCFHLYVANDDLVYKMFTVRLTELNDVTLLGRSEAFFYQYVIHQLKL